MPERERRHGIRALTGPKSTVKENSMLNRAIRYLAITAVSIVSATVLTALGATSASAAPTAAANPGYAQMAAQTAVPATPASANASAKPDTTGDLCDWYDNPVVCIQIYGSGLNVTGIHTWYYNDSPYTVGNYHIELYILYSLTRGVPYIFLRNCPEWIVGARHNSPVCAYGHYNAGQNMYYCAGLWEDGFGNHVFVGDRCVYVHA
jgi:hypothetical protein